MEVINMQPVQQFFTAENPVALFKQAGGTHQLSYYTWGDDTAEKTALCVHGMSRNARDFDFLAQALVANGYRVVAIEMAGRGNSDYLAESAAYCYELYCADVVAFMAHIQLTNVDWVGTSMGGLIGMMLAAADVAKPVEQKLIGRLLLNDIGPFIPKKSLMRIGKYIGQDIEFDTWEQAETRYREVMQPFGIVDEPHWQHVLKYAFLRLENGHYRYRYDTNISSAFWKNGKQIPMPDMDLTAMWQMITTPSYIIRGADSDLLLKSTFDDMAASSHVHSSVEFANVGHAPMLMSDEQIGAVLAFFA